jgi:hypothetical protein
MNRKKMAAVFLVALACEVVIWAGRWLEPQPNRVSVAVPAPQS